MKNKKQDAASVNGNIVYKLRKNIKIKLLIFSLLPTIFILATGEIVIRLFFLDRPSLISGTVTHTALVRPDVMGWSLKPDITIDNIITNKLGLRSPEVLPKIKNEFRILSLGESTTFGFNVSYSETYSAQLEKLLNETVQSKSVTMINAGVAAYSSFQSLKYLELRGLKLRPDMILFYHEANDYLPSIVRDDYLNEVGILKTDKQLYDSKLQKISRTLEKISACYRFLLYKYSNYKINMLNRKDIKNPISDIGLPSNAQIGQQIYRTIDHEAEKAGLNPMLTGIKISEEKRLNPMAIGKRVSEEERVEILTKLLSICNKNNIRLIIIHPSYAYSKPHECILTNFCRTNNVLMFEAYHSLHPENISMQAMFFDSWHPTPYGHKCLANDLARFLDKHVFLNKNS